MSWDWQYQPTTHQPGGRERLRVLQARAEAGMPVFHDHDAWLEQTEVVRVRQVNGVRTKKATKYQPPSTPLQ